MIKTFENFNKIDPYGEETWGDFFTLEDCWKLLDDDFFIFKHKGVDSIFFAINNNEFTYKGQKKLDFFIDPTENGELELSFISGGGIVRKVILYEPTRKGLLDKIKYLINDKNF